MPVTLLQDLLYLVAIPALIVAAIVLIGRRGTPARGAEAPQLARVDALAWVASVVVVAAAATLALFVGSALAVFGLAGMALVGALILVLIAATVWRTAAVSLALIAIALAGSASVNASRNGRIDPSHGTLVVRPADAAAASSQDWVRGLGSVLVDLRETKLRADRTTRIRARSDAGRVVVALPHDRCVNIRLVARPYDPMSLGAGYRTMVHAGIRAGAMLKGETGTTQTQFYNPRIRSGRIAGVGQRDYLVSEPPIIFYGQLLTRRIDRQTLRFERSSADPHAPWIEIDARAANELIIRDYPSGALGNSTAGDADRYTVRTASGTADPVAPELAGSRWPVGAALTIPDGAQWDTWRALGIASAANRARVAAGACASRRTLREHWAAVPSGPLKGRAVNGLGEIQPNRVGTTS